ncbi:MAG: hypothetical protein DWI69_11270 [Chloroflexi bacterium]|nr:MAG: hypothetical protein DWI69_11270 [Chloroflexota bacterium]
MNVIPNEATSTHPEPTPFLSQSLVRRRTAARDSCARASTELPEYQALVEADAAEQDAWNSWLAAREIHDKAAGGELIQVAAERCASAWEHFINSEARRCAAFVAWRRAYRALPAFDDLLMAAALSSVTASSGERRAA